MTEVFELYEDTTDGIFDVSLREKIQWESHKLDLFNLEVAKFRVKYGMSPQLIHLYATMGSLCRELIAIELKVGSAEKWWKYITGNFQAMVDKEEMK